MNNQRIIQLAEAMGLMPNAICHTYDGHTTKTVYIPKFDPFADANDDYAVLEWMRKTYQAGIYTVHDDGTTKPPDVMEKNAVFEEFIEYLEPLPCDYIIGNNARAACEVFGISALSGEPENDSA